MLATLFISFLVFFVLHVLYIYEDPSFIQSFIGLPLAFVSIFLYINWVIMLFAQGTTPGKIFLGMRVIKEDGSNAGILTMLIRELIGKWIISGLILSLGFLWILFDRDSQGWHDKLMRTYVVEDKNMQELFITSQMLHIGKKIGKHFSSPTDFRTERTLTGLFVGVCLARLTLGFFQFTSVVDVDSNESTSWYEPSWLAFLILSSTIWLAFRPIPGSLAMRQLLGLNLIVFIIFSSFMLLGLFFIHEGSFYSYYVMLLLVILLTAFVSGVFYWFIGKASKALYIL